MDDYNGLTYNPIGQIIGEVEADGRNYVITSKMYVYAEEFDGAVFLYEYCGTVGEMCAQSKEFREGFYGE